MMIAPHLWPKPIKHAVLIGVIAAVILAYMSLCAAGSLFGVAVLSQTHP